MSFRIRVCPIHVPGSERIASALTAERGREMPDKENFQRVINVSNAPPVSLTRKGSGCWEIKQGSGGLVACVDPVMSMISTSEYCIISTCLAGSCAGAWFY
uniref:Uncharacterized protein n=1 Tax=Parascaris equorum TaxID=6256 RepID=A0A914RIJ9_PAREQ